MDDSDKGFSSSTPIKPSVMPKNPFPGGTDENGLNYDMKNPKKQITKHFMSPTISAASKAAVPRKKILAERNQALIFTDTHNQNAPISNSKTSPLNLNSGRYSQERNQALIFTDTHNQNAPISNSKTTPLILNSGRYSRSSSLFTPLNSASESDDDDENSFVANSSLKPYDPLTNYLSPRPKFLRFKPNRCREVFLHQENEIREGKGGSGFRRRSASFNSQKAMVEEDSSADALPPSSHVGSVEQDDGVNNSEEDDSDEEIEEFEGKGLTLKGVLKFLLLFVVVFLSTSYISSMNSPTPSPTLQAIRGLREEYYKIQIRVFEAVTRNIHEGGSEFFYPIEEERTVESGFEVFGEMVDLQHGGAENSNHGEMEKTQNVFDVLDTEIVESEDVDQLKGLDIDESYGGVYDQELKDTVVGPDHYLQEMEIADHTDFGDHELEKKGENSTPLLAFSVSGKEVNVDSDSIDEAIDGTFDEGVGKDVVQNELERIEEEDITVNSGDEIGIPEAMDTESTKSDTIDSRVVMGFTTFSIVVASLCLGFHLRRHKRNSAKNSLPLEDSIHEPVIADNISPIIFHVEEDQKIQKSKVESFVNPKSLVHSMEEDSKGFYQSHHTPRAELLAEFAVGEMSSSLKSCGMKSKMMETIESNTSVSQEKGSLSKLVSELSTMDSPSYGSFTAEKKIVKKEEGTYGEVGKVLITPVRRSSRIHNRSIMSP